MLRFIALLFFTLNFLPLLACDNKEGKEEYKNPKLEFVKDNFLAIRADQLVSNEEHIKFLKKMLATAEEKVMISTYNLSSEGLFGEDNLGQDIIDAAERGIAIYIYYQNLSWFSKQDDLKLQKVVSSCVKFEQNANHSKCVIKDKKYTISAVAIGSYDWLGKPYQNSSNGSLIITGGLGFSLANDVWRSICFYQSLEYGNEQGIQKFLNNIGAFTTGEYQFAPGQFYYTLQTPEAHALLFHEALEKLEKAEEKVFLFSPFIRLQKLRDTLTATVLGKLTSKRDIHEAYYASFSL